jgi:hypothetical protein
MDKIAAAQRRWTDAEQAACRMQAGAGPRMASPARAEVRAWLALQLRDVAQQHARSMLEELRRAQRELPLL